MVAGFVRVWSDGVLGAPASWVGLSAPLSEIGVFLPVCFPSPISTWQPQKLLKATVLHALVQD